MSFQREILRADLVDSDHVIKYYYIHNGVTYPEYPPYIIMECADGGTLKDLLDAQRKLGRQFALDYIMDMCRQLADGMKTISQSLVHRDIKPENILIKNGVLKISDFGLSKYSKDATRTLTFKGYGTARYVAPEAWGNDKNTIQMDIYSMGIVFFEIATLQYPYHVPPNADALQYRDVHLCGGINNPYTINPSLPQSLVAVIVKMMEKPTKKRFAEWDSILEALNKYAKPVDNLTNMVELALANRNAADLKMQTEHAKWKKAEEEKKDRCRLIYSQYDKTIYEPIRNFVEQFNQQYVGDVRFRLQEKLDDVVPERFSLKISMPGSKWICIDTEIIFTENHTREVCRDPYFRNSSKTRLQYIPQCIERNVQAWSYVRDQSGRGFNLLLLEVPGELYGDWYLLRNTNSIFNNNPRVEPFGFTIQELPKEIALIQATHVFNSELLDFDELLLYEYLANHA